jgi:putative transposase
MSYTKNLLHLVFTTKNRKNVLAKEIRSQLFSAIGNTLVQNKCKPIIINGVEDHVHVLFGLHPTIALASVVKTVKLDANSFIKEKFPHINFDSWNEGYACFSLNNSDRQRVYDYIVYQEEHHKKVDGKVELMQLLHEHGIDFNELYLD